MTIAHPSRYTVSDFGQHRNVLLRRARKQWQCALCKAAINAGDRYAKCGGDDPHPYKGDTRYCTGCAVTLDYIEVQP